MSRSPSPETPAELIDFGWEIAEATLAGAASELTLVTHWFLTPADARANADGLPSSADGGVNVDDHFGSDERTLRFLAVALPTLIDQLGATRTVVALPWGLNSGSPTLTVIGVRVGAGVGESVRVATRALSRPAAGLGGPPFWRLSPDPVATPAELAAVAVGLGVR